MEKKKKLVPKLRFKEFLDAGDWEQRKSVDIADYSKGNGYSKSDLTENGTPIILYGRLYTKYQFAIAEVDTFATPKDGSIYSQGNEVIIPASGETAEDIARASAVEKSGILLGGDLNILRPFNFINPLFLALTISNGEPQKELAKKAQGKSVVHIHNSDIQEVTVSFPTRAEQDRIVAVFRSLDNLITLHQRKVDKLQQVKKAHLCEMFPENGKTKPKRRFKCFTDDWEQRKLGELGEIVTGSTPSTTHSEYYSDDGIPWVTPTDINENLICDTPRKLSDEGAKVSRVVPANTILCTCIASIGKNALLTVKGSFNQQINSLTPSKENDAYFLLTESELWSNTMKRMAASGTMQIVNKAEFSELQIMVPSLPEQQQIGTYFQQLDNLITLHQRKVEKLKKLKESYLNDMFV